MGCDIHATVEYKTDNGWRCPGKLENVAAPSDEPWYEPDVQVCHWRNYTLFAILANVRNGGNVTPISEPRGVPEDCSIEFQSLVKQWSADGHSHSFVTLAELLQYDWYQGYETSRVITLGDYMFWRGWRKKYNKAPEAKDKWLHSPSTSVRSMEEAEDIISLSRESDYEKLRESDDILVEARWSQNLTHACPEFWNDDLPLLLKLGREFGHSNVRLVFFFDN